MTDIHHRIGVESPSTDDVYAALTTIDGLSGWWTTDTTGDPGLGGKIAFRFLPGGFDMEVIELVPGERVRWRVVDGPPEWIGTTIDWRLSRTDGYTIVLLHPRGLGRAGGVPLPLQHQVGGVPAEPQGPGGDRHRVALPGRRGDQRLALSWSPVTPRWSGAVVESVVLHRPLGVGVGLVGAPGAGLHGVEKVLAECRVDVGDSPYGATDAVGHGGTSAFAAPPPVRCRPPSPKAWLSCSTSTSNSTSARSARAQSLAALASSFSICRSRRGLGRRGGLVRQGGAGGTADVDAAHQLECGHLTSGPGEEHGEIEHPLDVADGRCLPAVRQSPSVSFTPQGVVTSAARPGCVGGWARSHGEHRPIECRPCDRPERLVHRQRGVQVGHGVVVSAECGGERCEVVVDGAAVAHASAVDEVVAGQRPQPVVHLGLLGLAADRDDCFGDDHGHPAVVAAHAVAAILFERVAGEVPTGRSRGRLGR